MSTMILRAEVIFRDPPNSAIEAVEALERALNLAPPPGGIAAQSSVGELLSAQHPNQVYAIGTAQTQTASSFASFKGYTNRIQCDLAAPLVATDTISFGPIVLEWVAAAATEDEITIGASSAECATNLAAVINAHSLLGGLFFATASTDTVTVTFDGVGLEAQLVMVSASNALGNIIVSPGLTPERIGDITSILGNPVFVLTPGYDALAWESLVGEQIDCLDPTTMIARFSAAVVVTAFDSATDAITLSGSVPDLAAIAVGDIMAPVIDIGVDQSFISYGGRS